MSLTLQKCEEYIPGEVDIKVSSVCLYHIMERGNGAVLSVRSWQGNGISCKIQHYKLWRKVLKHSYPDAIIGKQRRNSISRLKQSFEKDVKGIRFIIRFK